jgi:nucleoside 2-deoxyribosyltransferase
MGFMERPRCYVASPLGFTEAGRYYYYREYLPRLESVVEPADPWSLTTAEEVQQAQENGESGPFALEIGRRNAAAIRRCSLLAAYLEGQEPDSGTVAEVGYAAALGLRCFGLRSDFRQAGENGACLNLQVESFIVESGGTIVATLDELVAILGEAAEAKQSQRSHSPPVATR